MTDAAPLDVDADLTLTADGDEVRIVGDGQTIVVVLPTLGTGRRLLRDAPWRPRETLARLDERLRAGGLSLAVALNGVVVGRIGADVRPGLLSRALDVPPFRVRPGGLLRALVRSPAAFI
ncbi:hypothetical protein ACFQH6_17660 [Halobacteriaceae archaeon GCM10025711]